MAISRAGEHPNRWGLALATWCVGVSAFQAALAVGAPWGAASWGGRSAGVLPGRLRVASAVAVPVAGAVGLVAAGRVVEGPVRQRVLLGTAIYAGVGVLANGASPSLPERAIWTPMSALGVLLALRARQESTI